MLWRAAPWGNEYLIIIFTDAVFSLYQLKFVVYLCERIGMALSVLPYVCLPIHDIMIFLYISCQTGPCFNIKMKSYQYRKSHCGDKTILRPSYLHNGISYTGKMTSLYWIRGLALVLVPLLVGTFIMGLKKQNWLSLMLCWIISWFPSKSLIILTSHFI